MLVKWAVRNLTMMVVAPIAYMTARRAVRPRLGALHIIAVSWAVVTLKDSITSSLLLALNTVSFFQLAKVTSTLLVFPSIAVYIILHQGAATQLHTKALRIHFIALEHMATMQEASQETSWHSRRDFQLTAKLAVRTTSLQTAASMRNIHLQLANPLMAIPSARCQQTAAKVGNMNLKLRIPRPMETAASFF